MNAALQTLALRGWHTALVQTGVRRLANQWHYRGAAPKPQMRLAISPDQIKSRYFLTGNDGQRIGHWQTGQVLPGDWDLSTRAFARGLKFNACQQHFVKNVPWDQTSAIRYGLEKIAEYGKYDDCRSEDDLVARYAQLDDLWAETKAANALPARASHDTTARTGILVHIDRNGELLFGNQGFHRLSIAKLAKLPSLVVVVGVVHIDALKTAHYANLMSQRV